MLRCQAWRGLAARRSAAFSAARTLSSSVADGDRSTSVPRDECCNIPPNIWKRVGADLHRRPGHPLNTIKRHIEQFIIQRATEHQWLADGVVNCFDALSPVSTTKACFDDLLVEPDHPSRAASDTYYVNQTHVLRTHMTAHDVQMIARGERAFLTTGDVYRRDEIDRAHYPVFHQLDAVRLFDPDKVSGLGGNDLIVSDLQDTLNGLARHLFGADTQVRWVDATFPFTQPSFEMEVLYNGEWLEVLGCGQLRDGVIRAAGLDAERHKGWAFGLGLERLAMVLFEIPDIRLFWSEDERFRKQFASGELGVKFEPYSKYPPAYRDITFWLSDAFHENAFCELVRETTGGDVVEDVSVIDSFTHPKSRRKSLCFRITYRHMDRSLTGEEVDDMQFRVRARARDELGVELR
ncbi:Phenylalanine--tRNA ligase, chloroplastic/mitochondrial [Porphyridium purpureum]|uniref:phenylalanine--tRNA ligase n=1 Tax=Porphyridium purpureum TaxID=35688 RepID=A0A5J4Z128_PORPP|nr:Phenylalanine--tRNA ligase, chloroplastic/mitochondrial [Porphyridium purpureum]|eukprot:POR1828..scf208_2